MPLAKLGQDFVCHYEIDDFTDSWLDADWVVLVHGVGESTEGWRPWVPHLARRYRVLRLDLRGFGRSSVIEESFPWSLEQACRDTEALTDHLGIGRFHWVGAKIGGTLGLHFAATRRDRLGSLSTFGAPMVGEGQIAGKIDGFINEIRSEGVEKWVRSSMPGRFGSTADADRREWWSTIMSGTQASSLISFFRAMDAVDIEGELPDIACPTMIVTSPGSMLGSTDEIRRWQETIPNSVLKVMPGDTYHLSATNPDEAAAITLEFIDRSRAATPVGAPDSGG